MSKQPRPSKSPLVDRYQAAEILNVSGMTVRRIEADGKLEPVKLRDGRTSKTFYRKHEVYALAGAPMPVSDVA
jgi:predicted site-specific integrase-resolvase